MPRIRRITLPDGITYDVGIESGAYKPAGSIAFSNLPVLSSSVLGYVYNITDAFTTTSDFIEGAGKTYPAGTNVGVIETEESGSTVYKFDVFSGFIDLSGKADTSAVVSSITRSGTTFTAKNSDGTTLFTFNQQDNDTTTGTTYTAASVPANTTFGTNGSIKNVYDACMKTADNPEITSADITKIINGAYS